MSGLLALLDDVAAIAKVAATSIDDIAAAAAKAGTKAAGVVIDDAAVTPKYVAGLAPARELPIIWRIARGSLFNKLVILLPLALLLSIFLPQAITPLLMLGGTYLCYEGAHKIVHLLMPHHAEVSAETTTGDPLHLEEARIKGAIKTDFILSAEVMAISLSAIPEGPVWQDAIVLAVVAVLVTAAVYGAVALIVKMDDVGLHMAAEGRLATTRALGKGLVKFMPILMLILSTVGTAAMLWVGGSILVHGLHELGFHAISDWIAGHAAAAAALVPQAAGAASWVTTAAFDGVFGLVVGLVVIPLVSYVINPAIAMFKR